MITGRWVVQGGDLTAALEVRNSVFGLGRDDKDDTAQSVVVYTAQGMPAGTARLCYEDGAFVIDRVCVNKSLRHQGYGDLLMRLLLYKAQSHFAKTLRLTPTEDTRTFFAKYGFTGDAGDMTLIGEQINLGCGH